MAGPMADISQELADIAGDITPGVEAWANSPSTVEEEHGRQNVLITVQAIARQDSTEIIPSAMDVMAKTDEGSLAIAIERLKLINGGEDFQALDDRVQEYAASVAGAEKMRSETASFVDRHAPDGRDDRSFIERTRDSRGGPELGD